MRLQAPAKLNLCLYLGGRRDDGLHSLCSLFEPLSLVDEIEVVEAERDEVVCPGVEGENLAARALAALREADWEAPPLRIEIAKRIPVAAGLGGGSADAAAILRLARDGFSDARDGLPGAWDGLPGAWDGLPGARDGFSGAWDGFSGAWDGLPGRAGAEAGGAFPGGHVPDLESIAARLGADVPSQLSPALALVQGAGERVERLPAPASRYVVLLPAGGGLSTAAVFAEADRLGLGRGEAELESLAGRLREAAGAGASPLEYPELLVNDLEPAARALRPDVGETLDALRAAGAPLALLTGSGPTTFGLFPTLEGAQTTVRALDRDDAIVCEAGRVP